MIMDRPLVDQALLERPVVEPGAVQHPVLERPVLVVEDDAGVAATICMALGREGWRTEVAPTLAAGRAMLRDANPRIVVVDLGLPDGNGISFVREAAAHGDLGIIVVSGRGDEVDRVVGLEIGADDYLAKPFSVREMVARVRALSRRLDAIVAGPSPAPPRADPPPAPSPSPSPASAPATAATMPEPASWMVGGVRLEPARLRVLGCDGAETRLTGGEAGLLQLLLETEDHLADRETISERVLGRRLLPEQRGVDQLASNLRHKLSGASAGRIALAGVRGKGYRLLW
jgi:DNA-binding response OmpR family regulator